MTPVIAPTLCFAVQMLQAQNTYPYAPILIDRCTGRTWILAFKLAPDAANPQFSWTPLPMGDEIGKPAMTRLGR